MKTICICIALIAAIMQWPSYAKTLTFGYFDIPPHMYQDTEGTARGASINYVNAVFQQMGYDIKWVGPLPYGRLLRFIEDGALDGVPLMQEAEKEPLFYFPNAPYYSPQPILALKKNNPLQQISSIDDIRNFKIGFIAGVEPSPFIKAHQQQLDIIYRPQQQWLEINLLSLQHDRIDAVYGLNQVSTQIQAQKMGMADEIKILPLPEPPGEMFIGISKKSANALLIIDNYNRQYQSFTVSYEQLLADELQKE